MPELDSLDALRIDTGAALIEESGTVVARGVVTDVAEPGWPYSEPGSERTTGGAPERSVVVVMRPYHDWANRGPSTMRVWVPTYDAG